MDKESYSWMRRVFWKQLEGGNSICCNSNPEEATRIDIEVLAGAYTGSYTWEFDAKETYKIERLERMLRKAFEYGRRDAKIEIQTALGVLK